MKKKDKTVTYKGVNEFGECVRRLVVIPSIKYPAMSILICEVAGDDHVVVDGDNKVSTPATMELMYNEKAHRIARQTATPGQFLKLVVE